MDIDKKQLANLLAKEDIRDLALLYSRGVDRKDPKLLRTLYTEDATDTHGDTFDGSAGDYVDFLETAFPYMRYSGHHICNHLISVDGDQGEGEVYAIAYHVLPDGNDGWVEDLMCVRYLDNYQRCSDGRWRFAKRVVTYDMRNRRAITLSDDANASKEEPSYADFTHALFARGGRH